MTVQSLPERLAGQIVITDAGCWQWTGTTSDGYGRITGAGRSELAHRVVFELIRGPVPEGLELDHVCHTRDTTCAGGTTCPHRRCVNPVHLEPVTRLENWRRGRSFSAVNARKTHCDRGHELHGENLYVDRDGGRECRTCMRDRNRVLRGGGSQEDYNAKRQAMRLERARVIERMWAEGASLAVIAPHVGTTVNGLRAEIRRLRVEGLVTLPYRRHPRTAA